MYEDKLYELFVETFINNHPTFNNKPVHVKKYPLDGNREHAFTHLTCKTESDNPKNVNDRLPDLRRAERITWIKSVIENYPCLEKSTYFFHFFKQLSIFFIFFVENIIRY